MTTHDLRNTIRVVCAECVPETQMIDVNGDDLTVCICEHAIEHAARKLRDHRNASISASPDNKLQESRA